MPITFAERSVVVVAATGREFFMVLLFVQDYYRIALWWHATAWKTWETDLDLSSNHHSDVFSE